MMKQEDQNSAKTIGGFLGKYSVRITFVLALAVAMIYVGRKLEIPELPLGIIVGWVSTGFWRDCKARDLREAENGSN